MKTIVGYMGRPVGTVDKRGFCGLRRKKWGLTVQTFLPEALCLSLSTQVGDSQPPATPAQGSDALVSMSTCTVSLLNYEKEMSAKRVDFAPMKTSEWNGA